MEIHDLTKAEAKDLHKEWERLGKPPPDRKGKNRREKDQGGGALPDILPWFSPWWASWQDIGGCDDSGNCADSGPPNPDPCP